MIDSRKRERQDAMNKEWLDAKTDEIGRKVGAIWDYEPIRAALIEAYELGLSARIIEPTSFGIISQTPTKYWRNTQQTNER